MVTIKEQEVTKILYLPKAIIKFILEHYVMVVEGEHWNA